MPESKSEPTLAEPHDTLVRWTFSQRKHAAGLLRAALPPDLTRPFDWRTLRLEKGSFVNKELRKRHSDLLFSIVAAGQPLWVYVLIEHQRKVDALMAFRMLVYMTRLWEQFVRDHPGAKALPAVVPILLHHSETGWTAARAFEDLIAAEGVVRAELERHIPRFEMRLVDVSPEHASALADGVLTAVGKLALWCLSVAGDDERMKRELVQMASVMDEVLAVEDGLAAFGVVMRYLGATHPRMSAEKIRKLLEKAVSPQGQEKIVTFLDEIEQRGEARGKREGKREGKLEGKREGKREVLLDQLAARFGRVPARIQARIRAADEAALGRWTMRVLTAASCVEVIGDDAEDAGAARAGSTRSSTKRTTVAHRRGVAATKRA